MKRTDRHKPATGWMHGYGQPATLEATCQALEARLREGQPHPFADAPRVHLEADWWGL